MSVIEAKIQTVEDMYRLVWAAVANRQPIRAIYKELPRLLCPHRLGRNRLGEPRVLCYQYGGESEKRIAADRVAGELALRRFRETAPRGIVERFLEDCPKSFSSSNVCGRGGY